jgi:hypothetical protein
VVTLDGYGRFVEELERGRYPLSLDDQAAAASNLVRQLCAGPWETAEERTRAQHLVHRLEHLLRLLPQTPGSPEPEAGQGPAGRSNSPRTM